MPQSYAGLPGSSDPIVEGFRDKTDPFVVAAQTTRMPMIFTEARDGLMSVVFANESFLKLVSRSRDSVCGRPLEVFLAETLDRASFALVKLALAVGREGEWDLPCRSADGTVFWAKVFASPVRDNQGKLTHNFLSFVRLDRKGEEELETRDELTALYELAPGFIAISKGPNHLITFANASYKRFVNTTDLVGLTVKDAMPTLVAQGAIDLLDTVFRTGVPYVASDMEFTFDDKATGKTLTRYADFVYQPIRGADDRVTGLFCEGYDVTEKHLAADRMTALQNEVIYLSRVNAMGTMAATLAHELNQPLTAISNYSEAGLSYLSRQGAAGINKASEALEGIQVLSARVGAMIKNLRDLTAQRQSNWAEFDLSDAADDCIRLVEAAINQPMEVVNQISKPMHVIGDRIQIQQVLINLLKNSSEARETARHLKIKICESRVDNFVRISVKDNGAGVGPGPADSLFNINKTSKADGMGIGLSISRTIVESHGGHIWLRDTSSAGTEFCFTMPIAHV